MTALRRWWHNHRTTRTNTGLRRELDTARHLLARNQRLGGTR